MGKRRVGTGWKAILTSAPISTKLLDIIRIQEIGEKLGLDAQLKKRFLEYCNFINRSGFCKWLYTIWWTTNTTYRIHAANNNG